MQAPYVAPLTPKPPVITTVPEPVPVEAVPAVNVDALLAVNVVNAPLAGCALPIETLHIAPVEVGAKVNVPDGLTVTFPLGLIVAVVETVKVSAVKPLRTLSAPPVLINI
jgi:hypothetical protein